MVLEATMSASPFLRQDEKADATKGASHIALPIILRREILHAPPQQTEKASSRPGRDELQKCQADYCRGLQQNLHKLLAWHLPDDPFHLHFAQGRQNLGGGQFRFFD